LRDVIEVIAARIMKKNAPVKLTGAGNFLEEDDVVYILKVEFHGERVGVSDKEKDLFGVGEPTAGARRWRVLIVDDCSKTIKLLETEFADQQFEILKAGSADEATRLIIKEETRPDLILLDVNMPGVSGLQFCRFVKANSQFEKIKVILCSSMDAGELEAAAKRCGADGFVHKETILGRWVLDQLTAE